MGLAVARIDIFRQTKPFLGFVELRGIKRDDAEVVERSFMFWIEIEHGVIKGLGCASIVLSEPQIAKREKCFRIVRHVSVGDRKFSLGELEIV